MPALKHEVRERFAQLMAAGAERKGEAFREAYTGSPKGKAGMSDQHFSEQASRALARDDVNERIEEIRLGAEGAARELPRLQAEVAQKISLTIERAIFEADRIQRAAFAEKQYAAATAALIAKAKLAGIWVERSESVNAHYAISDKPLSDEEWKAKYVTTESLN
jgi:hypothetical protein